MCKLLVLFSSLRLILDHDRTQHISHKLTRVMVTISGFLLFPQRYDWISMGPPTLSAQQKV